MVKFDCAGILVRTALCLGCCLAVGAFSQPADSEPKAAVASRPTVGAIRWDGWNQWGRFEVCFDPPEWRYRLPFFAEVTADGRARLREDSQEVMDKEIAYAKGSGLDYWAFVWYHPEGWPPHSADMGRCFRLYLSSAHKSDINYCLIISGGPHLGPKERLSETLDYLVERFKDPDYQTVPGGRPLVYFFQIADIVSVMGSEESARALLDDLRERTVAAGAGNPYFVVMTFWPPQGAQQAEKLGCDAIGSYSGHGGTENKEFPYTALADYNRKFWAGCKATGKQVVPTANAGWDFRPMKRPEFPDRDPKADWFQAPTPQELTDHVNSAMSWVENNPSVCPANTVLIYAWNELSEGGWLVPTLREGTARLDELSRILKVGED